MSSSAQDSTQTGVNFNENEQLPPHYESVINVPVTGMHKPLNFWNKNLNLEISNIESPPTYDSLFKKLKKAKDESSNPIDYMSKACGIVCGSCNFLTYK
jgi:hypothetical protein